MAQKQLQKNTVILLDVYETLLDMSDVERKVNNLMDSKRGYHYWFEIFMQYSFVDNCTNQFHDFGSIAKATLKIAAHNFGKVISEAEATAVLDLLKQLPVHEEIQQGLSKLNDEGYRIAALTNSPERIVCDRMERTGLISYFELVISAEEIKKYKPCIEAYQLAAKKLKVSENEILVASSHSWDIMGAANAGMKTAFIKRNDEMLYPLAPQPDYVCKNLPDLALQLS
ncbi:MAG: haloacid dehalogenase type II [Ilyomonas sp.]